MRLASITGLTLLVAACAATHIRPHTPRHRHFDPGGYGSAPAPVSEGSLWLDSSRGLFADFRASRVGDLVTIHIDESPRASGDASTDMDRQSNMSLGVPSFLGFAQALTRSHPDLNASELIDVMSESGFQGTGRTRRGSRVRGSIAVRVRSLLPNGDLFVEGTKIIMVNDEELHIYVSGVVRPEDIDQDNTVRSSLIADAQVEFSGRGALTDNQEQGWLMKILSAINPF